MNKKLKFVLIAVSIIVYGGIAFKGFASNSDSAVRDFIKSGISYGKQKDYAAAIGEFNKAIKLDPSSAKAYFNLGVVYELMRQYDPAMSAYKQAIAIQPTYAKAYYNLAPLYGLRQDFPKVIELYQTAFKLAPTLATDQSYSNLSGAYFYTNNLEQAKATALKATQINPKSGPAHFQLGIAYLYLGNAKQARAQCRVLKRLREKALAKKLFKEIERVSW